METSILQSQAPLTFADYSKSNLYVQDVLAEFGYTFRAQRCAFPVGCPDEDRLAQLQARFDEALPHISLNSEIARREFLIAPIVYELIHYTQADVRPEFPLEVGDKLKGTIDYFLQARHRLLIIEARNEDLTRGFTQLAVELVAVDRWLDDDDSLIHGTVSTGNVWQFAALNRIQKQIIQDLNLYTLPNDLRDLLAILLGLLTAEVPP